MSHGSKSEKAETGKEGKSMKGGLAITFVRNGHLVLMALLKSVPGTL